MKKLLYAVVISMCLVISSAAVVYGASTSLVGAKIQGIFEVVIDGKKIADAIAVDGRVYVPLRSISESLNADLKVEGKKVMVTTTEQSTDVGLDERSIILKGKVYGFETSILTKQEQVIRIQDRIKEVEATIAGNEASPAYKDFGIVFKDTSLYKELTGKIAEHQSQIATLNAEIADLQAEKATVEAELAS